MLKRPANCLRGNKSSRCVILIIAITLLSVIGSYLYFQVQMKNQEEAKALCYLAGEIFPKNNKADINQTRNGMLTIQGNHTMSQHLHQYHIEISTYIRRIKGDKQSGRMPKLYQPDELLK